MAGHDTNTTTGTTGTTTSSSAPRVTTAGTGAGRSLNYALDFRTLDRLKQANLDTAKGELQKLGQVTQFGKIATTGIALTSQAMQQGTAITQEKIGLWKDFSDRESWASPEYYEAFMAEEDKFREEYELAVKRGETQKADRLLADQTKRSSNLQGFVKNAESAKQMYDQGLYLKYDPALGEKNIITEADDFFLTKFIETHSSILDLYGSINCANKSLLDNDKSNGLDPYKYCLTFDNQNTIKPFFGTQFTDTILRWGVPLYWGGAVLEEYFPKDSFIKIDIEDPNCIDNVIKFLETDDYEQRIPAIKEARELILDQYNMWPLIKFIIQQL